MDEMSFSYRVKAEIIEKINTSQKADACLMGLLCCCNELSDREILFLTENPRVKDFFVRNVSRILRDEDAVSVSSAERRSGVTLFSMTIPDEGQRIFLLDYFGMDESRRLTEDYLPKDKFIPQLAAGIFLACGSVNDPNKKYHMEYVMPTLDLCNDFGLLLIERHGIVPKHVERKGAQIVYIKESENIIDVLTLMGATMCSLELMNVKMEKDMRNKINRAMNCDNANIDKTLKASERQIEDIELIEKKLGLSSLPDQLREIAELRLENPDYNLKQLGAEMVPPISRSGANHRLQKLAEIADGLRKKQSREGDDT
ncbi:DNA-binding protein WhiA [Ruminococcus sp.]|uniref:DNA-binding protein WhiA n=1 Tax=Ruminococcus sp. TaxID=41978 RepID=UPI0025E33119|nr:DNA-binding protein WhiA [Ruminococcus sp.]